MPQRAVNPALLYIEEPVQAAAWWMSLTEFMTAFSKNTRSSHAAVKKALQLGAVGFDAVKHLVLCHVEKRPPKLDLDVYPYLPRATVGTTSAASYMSLLSRDVA